MAQINLREKNLEKYYNIKIIMRLGIPAIIENILQVFIGVVDTYFVGKIGILAIAGVGVTNLTMNVYISFFLALGIGTTALVSRFIGEGENEKADNAVKQSIIMSFGIGLIFGVINLIFSKQILLILGAQKEIVEYALPYFITVAVPSVFLCVNIVLSSALRGAGDTKTPMKAAILSNIINAFLDYVLIFGVFNFRGFGILGAGLATTTSRIISVIILMKKIISSNSKISILLFEGWKIDYKILKSIMNIGIPSAVEKLIMRSGQLIYGGMIIQIGAQAYAAHNIAGIIESFSYLPGMGFGVAAATLVGQNLGKKKEDEAEKVGLISYFLSTVFMIGVGALFFVFAPLIASLFTKDEVVILQVVKVLRIIAFFQPFLSITLVISSALQGAGDTKFPMYTSLIGIWGIRVLGVYILCMKLDYGLVGVWSAYAIDITVRGIILIKRYLNGNWKNISIT